VSTAGNIAERIVRKLRQGGSRYGKFGAKDMKKLARTMALDRVHRRCLTIGHVASRGSDDGYADDVEPSEQRCIAGGVPIMGYAASSGADQIRVPENWEDELNDE